MAIPTLLDLLVQGNSVAMRYSEALNPLLPSVNRFVVMVNGRRVFATGPATLSADGTTILLTLASPIATGATVTVTYGGVNGADKRGFGDIRSLATDEKARFHRPSPATKFTSSAPPTVTISSDSSFLKAAETATITFTFSHAPAGSFTWDGTSGDITVTGGTLSALSPTADAKVYTAIFTPSPGTTDSGFVSIAAGSYTDLFGTPGAASLPFKIVYDTLAPSLAQTNIPQADSRMVRSTRTFTLQFSEPIALVGPAHSVAQLRDASGQPILFATGSLAPDGRMLQLELAEAPSPSSYQLEIHGALIHDLAGNGLAGGPLVFPLTITPYDDIRIGTAEDEFLATGNGHDLIEGRGGSDTLSGASGNDRLVGGDGHEVLRGGAGDDHLDVGTGGGTAYGEAGNDVLQAELTGDNPAFVTILLNGGSGDDRLSVSGTSIGNVTLFGGGGSDVLSGSPGIDNLDDGDDPYGDARFNPLNGHWYRLLPTATTWEGAKAAAAASWLGNEQGYLVTITSAEEQDFLTTTFGYPSAWIGASDEQDEGTWRWVGGPEAGMMFYVQGQESQTGFNHWSPGEPNNLGEEDAAGFWIGNNSWNDFSATTLQSLLIEYGGTSADPSEPVTQPGDTLFGGAGNDTIISRGDTDQIDGGAGIDRLALDLSKTTAAVSLSLADPTAVQNLPGGGSVVNVEVLQLTSGSGDDSIVGGEGYDILSGAAGDDVLDVGPGGGEAYGGSGRDHLRGSGTESSLLLKGGAGDDLFEVGAGGGQALGEAGDDVLQATLGGAEDPGSLSLNGGPGNDRLSVTGRLMGYVELDGGGGQDSLSGGMGNDVLLDGDGRFEDAVFNPTNGHWYRLITTSMSWEEARATASNSQLANRQGYLVTITSQEEQEFLKQAFDFNGVWLGASDADEEGTWRWLDGPEAGTVFHVQGQEVQPDYSNWDLGEPSGFSGENVAGTWLYNFTWNDFDQHEFTRYLLIEYGGMPNDSLEAVVLPGDTLQGGDGDDQIMSRGDTDQIDGGGGMDQLSWDLSRTSADLTLSLADPSVVQVLPGGGSVVNVEMIDLVSGSGNDSLQGGSGFDRLNGEAGNDVLDLWSGGGSASGGEGDDVLLAALTNEHRDGSVYLDGNAGNDRIRVTGAHSTYVRLTGGGGLDSLQGSDGNDVLDDGDNGYEDAVFNPLNGHWYRYLPGAMTWDQARTAAAASRFLDRQGYVVTITSAQEQAFLRSMFGSYFSAWIGASDAAEEGTWRWVDGPEAGHVFFVQGQDPQPGYSNWAEGQPEGDWDSEFELGVDEDVAGFFGYWSGNNLWHDMPIDQRLGLLIEYGGTSGDGSNAMYPPGDTLLGGDGDDTIVSQGGSDQIDGGTGLDQLSLNFSLITWDLSCSFADSSLRQLLPFGGSVVNVEALDLETGSGDDTIVGGSGYDTLYGGAGDDHLDLGLGGGSAYGEEGDDELIGGRDHGQVFLDGGQGNDRLDLGVAGGDAFGGAGDDHILGLRTADTRFLLAGAGDDRIELQDVGAARVVAYGEDDDDSLQAILADANAEISLTFKGGRGDDRLSVIGFHAGYLELDGGGGLDSLVGSSGNDELGDGDGEYEDALFNPLNGHWYRFFDSSMSWDEAQAAAAIRVGARQGYLATITSAEEQDFLTSTFDFSFIWIGASDAEEEGSWRWLGGPEAGSVFYVQDQESQPGYSNWDGNQPYEPSWGGPDYSHDYAYIYRSLPSLSSWFSAHRQIYFDGAIVEYGGSVGDASGPFLQSGDTLLGGEGDDVINSRGDTDRVDGGDGQDLLRLNFSRLVTDVTLSLADPSIAQVFQGGGSLVNVERIDLNSGGGNDHLVGGDGADTLRGGAGDDLIDGGLGIDEMWGGPGADRFRFSAVPDSRASDLIFDFSSTEGDQFHLLAAVFADLGSLGSLAEDRFMLGPVATHPNHRILYDFSLGQLLYDSDGDASLAPVPFAHVPQGLSLSSSQFLVV